MLVLAGVRMFRRTFFAALGLLLAASSVAPQQAPGPELPPVLLRRVTTRLVLVDVVVTDGSGPVTDLTREDFTLLDEGEAQPIAVLSLEQPSPAPARAASMPTVPAQTYVNRPDYPAASGPLVILLLDALNTDLEGQAFAREKLLAYAQTRLQPGQPTAVLALGNQLEPLQDFTTEPAAVRAALERYRPQVSTALLRERKTEVLAANLPAAALPELEQMAADLERFDAERAAAAREIRVRDTLSALEAIARATAGYPGRKNLIWVAAAFPFTFLPGDLARGDSNLPKLPDADLYRTYARELQRAANLMAEARVAVYPIDARGLPPTPGMDASDQGPTDSIGRNPRGPQHGLEWQRQSDRAWADLTSSHATMDVLAAQTGGRAYYNRNDLETAVALSATDASTYYLLGYYPQHRNWDGGFRRVQVTVARAGVQVRHRPGYYAVDPTPTRQQSTEEFLAAFFSPLPATALAFQARILPSEPASPREVQIEFLVPTDAISFQALEGGIQYCRLDFFLAAFSAQDGKLVEQAGRTAEWRLTPSIHAQVRRQRVFPFRLHFQLPPGAHALRLGVRDPHTGRVGTLIIPSFQPPSAAAPPRNW